MQPPRRKISRQQFRKSGLENGTLSPAELFDLGLVHIHTPDIKSDFGKARGRHQSHIARTYYDDFHSVILVCLNFIDGTDILISSHTSGMGIRETAGTVPSFRPTDGKMLPGRLDPTASRAAKDVTPSPALSASCRKRGPKRPGQAARRTNFLPVQLQPCRKLRERNSGHLQEQTGINASALPEQGDNARVQDGSAAERAQGEHAPERAQDGNIRVRNAGRDARTSSPQAPE